MSEIEIMGCICVQESDRMSRSLPAMHFTVDPPLFRPPDTATTELTVDPYAKKPFKYRGKLLDTTTVLDKSILKERDMSKKVFLQI